MVGHSRQLRDGWERRFIPGASVLFALLLAASGAFAAGPRPQSWTGRIPEYRR